MSGPIPLDSLEALVSVDNVTDSLSSVPSFVETEFAHSTGGGAEAGF